MALLPPSPIGQPPGNSFWNDWYEKLRSIINKGDFSVPYNNITGKPTTFSGLGINTTSLDLRNSLTDETGVGVVVFNDSPLIVNPLIRGGTGAPAGALGNNGDYYFRGDLHATPGSRVYIKTGGSWVGIL